MQCSRGAQGALQALGQRQVQRTLCPALCAQSLSAPDGPIVTESGTFCDQSAFRLAVSSPFRLFLGLRLCPVAPVQRPGSSVQGMPHFFTLSQKSHLFQTFNPNQLESSPSLFRLLAAAAPHATTLSAEAASSHSPNARRCCPTTDRSFSLEFKVQVVKSTSTTTRRSITCMTTPAPAPRTSHRPVSSLFRSLDPNPHVPPLAALPRPIDPVFGGGVLH